MELEVDWRKCFLTNNLHQNIFLSCHTKRNRFMKKTLLSVFLSAAFLVGIAQSETASKSVPGRTAFYAELGGPGILFSANIDTRFKPSHLGLGGRAGIGFVTG